MAKQRTVRGRWKGGWRCDVTAGDFTLIVDEPESVPGGANQGPQPTELLLASVASCFSLALAHAANKRAIELSHIVVDATGVYDGPSFSAIHVHAELDCEEAELDRLLETAGRVCYVTNTLRRGPELTVAASVVPSADSS